MADYRLVLTCEACPTQYDVLLPDGRYGYFRARHSQWQFELYTSKESHYPGGEPPIMAAADQFDDPEADNGFMEEDEVRRIIDERLPVFLEHWDDVRAKLGR